MHICPIWWGLPSVVPFHDILHVMLHSDPIPPLSLHDSNEELSDKAKVDKWSNLESPKKCNRVHFPASIPSSPPACNTMSARVEAVAAGCIRKEQDLLNSSGTDGQIGFVGRPVALGRCAVIQSKVQDNVRARQMTFLLFTPLSSGLELLLLPMWCWLSCGGQSSGGAPRCYCRPLLNPSQLKCKLQWLIASSWHFTGTFTGRMGEPRTPEHVSKGTEKRRLDNMPLIV